MRISDWSSDVCSSDLLDVADRGADRVRLESATDHLDLGQLGHSGSGRSVRGGHGGVGGVVLAGRAVRLVALAVRRPSSLLQIGRASWREGVCTYVKIPAVAG